MGIVDDDIRRVREESDIIRLITQHTQLKKVGRDWVGLCPFHSLLIKKMVDTTVSAVKQQGTRLSFSVKLTILIS